MDRALDRIRKITQELNQIQAELSDTARADHPAKVNEFLDEPAGLDVLSSFKMAVDELRRFMWFYIDDLSKSSGENAEDLMQGYRLRRATEMLRVLCRTSGTMDLRAIPGGQSFLEQVSAVVEGYLSPKGGDASVPALKRDISK